MSELLTREKEYRKLNEKLDNYTNMIDESNKMTVGEPKTGACRLEVNRYSTYTKSKGPSTLLKKRGAGDGFTTGANVTTGHMNTSAHPHSIIPTTNGIPDEHCRLARGKTNHSTTSKTCDERYSHTSNNVTQTLHSAREGVTNPKDSIMSHRKLVKTDTTRTSSRTSNKCNTIPASFTIKYRNPKFVESPSLEILMKDESASIRDMIPIPKTKTSPKHFETPSPSSTECINSIGRNGTNQSRKSYTTAGLIKFLKSKITILEEDHERITVEMNQQKELLEKTLERSKRVEQQRDQAYIKHNALSDQLNKVENQLAETTRAMKEQSGDCTNHMKELQIAKREIRLLTQTNTNLEKKLYRANEDLETTKNTLAIMKNVERELKDSARLDNDGKDKQIKILKQQRTDLLNAYKKQLFLIDNLKRQNVCMEQAQILNFGEKEFTKVLDWNIKN